MADFAQAAARRYSGNFDGLPKVKYWQIQNEPNLYLFFNPQFGSSGNPISPRIFRKLLDVVYRSIKKVDRKNLVLAGGLAPNGVPGSLAPMTFTRKLLCMNRRNRLSPSSNACDGGVKFDVFDIHPYTSGGPTHKAIGKHDNVQMGNLVRLKRLWSRQTKPATSMATESALLFGSRRCHGIPVLRILGESECRPSPVGRQK